MLYFVNPSTPIVRDAMRAGLLGMIKTPAQGNALIPGVPWCADNGCFGKGYPGDASYLAWLGRLKRYAGNCAFATAPDVVGDAEATLERSRPMLPRIRWAGFRAALVAQDGLENLAVPWGSIDALFIGGSTRWKLGPGARRLVSEARLRGKWAHMGRVNSERRLVYADAIGCQSADGTYIAFGPDVNLPKVLRWLAKVNGQGTLELAA